MNVVLQVLGLRELQTTLTRVEANFKRAARGAMDKGLKVQLDAAKAGLTSVRTGLLKKSLGKRVVTYPSGTVVGLVGVRRGYKATLQSVQQKGRRRVLIGTRLTRKGAKEIKLKAAAGVRLLDRKGNKVRLSPALYVHLIEGGVRPHAVGKGSSRRRGRQGGRPHPGFKARPFLGPARKTTEAQVKETIKAALAAALARKGAS